MLHQQLNRCTSLILHYLPLLPPLLHQFLVKLDKEQSLILYSIEEVVFSDKVEHVRTSKAEEEREGFAWLSVGCVSVTAECR